jgi:Xaa-Pro aminopeptidase
MGGRLSGLSLGRFGRSAVMAWVAAVCCIVALATVAPSAWAQQRREREPNSVYAARRAKLAAEVDGPIVLWGYTGREEFSEAAIFAQEENFYYLTGHNEEGAALVIFPSKSGGADARNEILFLPPKNPQQEKWNGVRMSPTDPGIEAKTGFRSVQPISELTGALQKIGATHPEIYTVVPYETEMGGYPHEKDEMEWLDKNVPQLKRKDIREQIGALRQIKSQGELAFLKEAVDLSDDAHLEAMKMMRPGLYEYQVAAKMVEVHLMGGSEAEGYSPIVGAGPNSTALHYDKLSRKIEDGDIVVLDVGAQFSGYSADITRTLPANGKFTPRQREIYEIVLGAQNAAIAAVKPGAQLCRKGENSLFKISYDYINSHGKDKQGKPLGQYFIHGLGHHIGLNVHDVGDPCRTLEPGMVVTIEPGIYIPDENLGVRIEDDVLVTETGVRVLSEKLPRNPDEIEKIMADAAKKRAADGKKSDN